MAESGMDVDVLGVFGRSGQVDADVAGHAAEAAGRVAREHPNGRLRAHHDVPAELLEHGVSRLGDLRDAVLDGPDRGMHLGHPRVHVHRPRIPRFFASTEVAPECPLPDYVVAFRQVEVAEVFQCDGGGRLLG